MIASKQLPILQDEDAEMTAKAAEAFATYAAMGPGRSLTNLAILLVERKQYKSRTTARAQMAKWSTRYRWQERIAAAFTTKSEEMLMQMAEYDLHALLISSELLYRQMLTLQPENIDDVIKIRQMVRRPEPRTGSESVNVGFAVALRDAVDAIAAEEGVDPEELLARAERIVADHQR